MSRIGNKAITVPAGVEVNISSTNEVAVKGPKGTLTRQFSPLMDIKKDGEIISVARQNEQKHTKQLHGTTRALLNNMIVGVSEGFVKELELVGIGFKANLKGKVLELIVGYSHPVNIEIEDGVTCEVASTTEVKISGIDKQRVGECAANIRAVRKPEPYKGKGIRYKGEYIRRKEGKTAAKKG